METTAEDEKIMFIHEYYSEKADITSFWGNMLNWWQAKFHDIKQSLTKNKYD